MPNQILAIAPYWLGGLGTWVFDDPKVDLCQEPFVSGVPEMIDFLVKDIPNAMSPGASKPATERRFKTSHFVSFLVA